MSFLFFLSHVSHFRPHLLNELGSQFLHLNPLRFGNWQVFDARFPKPRIGRVRISSGYDAGNCAFTTIYGAASWSGGIIPRDFSASRNCWTASFIAAP